MAKLKALIFDLDGTLIDSLADLAEAVNRMLDDCGYPRQDLAKFPQFIGDGVRQLVHRALPEDARDEENLTRCTALYQEHYARLWHDQTHPYPGIRQLLDALKDRGVKIACISNKPDHFTQLCCQHFFPGEFAVVFGQRAHVPRKPDSAGGIECAQLLGFAPQECGYVGDSGIDMQFARNSGMTALGVSWGFRGRAELTDHGADAVVDTAAELLDWVA
jgi:phosphoglycolate phosphatase